MKVWALRCLLIRLLKVYNDLIGPEHKVIRGSIGVEFAAEPNPAVARVYGSGPE